MKIKTKQDRRRRIQLRIRSKVVGTAERPRVSVFRSASHVYAQAIDDGVGRTIVSVSSLEPTLKAHLAGGPRGGNRAGAELVGRTLAERLLAKGVKRAVFDRGGYLYHGRVKAVADAVRSGGLEL